MKASGTSKSLNPSFSPWRVFIRTSSCPIRASWAISCPGPLTSCLPGLGFAPCLGSCFMKLQASSFFTLVDVSMSPSGSNNGKKGCHGQGGGGDSTPIPLFLYQTAPAWPGVMLQRRAGVQREMGHHFLLVTEEFPSAPALFLSCNMLKNEGKFSAGEVRWNV